MSRSRIWPGSRVSTRSRRRACRSAPAIALERRDREYEERYRQLGVEDDLASLEGLTPGMLVTLGENGIKTLDDFAGLAGDELVEMLGGSDKGGAKLELDEANALIMAARERAHWFDEAGAETSRRARGEGVERDGVSRGTGCGGELRRHEAARLPRRRSAAASPPARCAIAPGCCALSSVPTGRSCPISTSGSPDGVCG